jgi:hypothetical protein
VTTANDGFGEEASKDETSLFDKQLYDRSLMENLSQDVIPNTHHFVSQEHQN